MPKPQSPHDALFNAAFGQPALARSELELVLPPPVRDERARSLLRQLYSYLLRDAPPDVEAGQVRAILEQVAGEHGGEDLMNAGEQLIAEGLERGRAEGRAEGRVAGIAEGRTEALRTAIVTALSARGLSLSDAGREKLASCADADVLTHWLARAVTVNSEVEIFASERS